MTSFFFYYSRLKESLTTTFLVQKNHIPKLVIQGYHEPHFQWQNQSPPLLKIPTRQIHHLQLLKKLSYFHII